MGCSLCTESSLRGPLEISYDNMRISMSRRPINITELYASVHKLAGSSASTEDLVVEYLGIDGLRYIATEVALQEAYILHDSKPLVLGVRVLSSKRLDSTEATKEF